MEKVEPALEFPLPQLSKHLVNEIDGSEQRNRCLDEIEAQHEAEFHTRPTRGPWTILQENRNLVFPVVAH